MFLMYSHIFFMPCWSQKSAHWTQEGPPPTVARSSSLPALFIRSHIFCIIVVIIHDLSLFLPKAKKPRLLLIDVIAFCPTTPTMRCSRFSQCWRWCCVHVLLGVDGACACKSQLPRGKFNYIKKKN